MKNKSLNENLICPYFSEKLCVLNFYTKKHQKH